jgi:1-acyl-sn-glycerol-3-phosphate acyltransferase
MRFRFCSLILSLAIQSASEAFAPRSGLYRPLVTPLAVSVAPNESLLDFRIEREDTNPIIRVGKGENEKVVNGFGLWCLLVSILTGTFWMAAMMMVDGINKSMSDWDPNFSIFDKTGKLWAKTWLTMTNSFPTITGDVERLRKGEHGPCLYVANHASWLDIPVLCTVLDPVFKFIAKGELRKVPLIGQQLEGVSALLIQMTIDCKYNASLVVLC